MKLYVLAVSAPVRLNETALPFTPFHAFLCCVAFFARRHPTDATLLAGEGYMYTAGQMAAPVDPCYVDKLQLGAIGCTNDLVAPMVNPTLFQIQLRFAFALL